MSKFPKLWYNSKKGNAFKKRIKPQKKATGNMPQKIDSPSPFIEGKKVHKPKPL